MNKIILFIYVIMFSCIQSALSQQSNPVEIKSAWVRLMPPSETSTAAYMVIENNTDNDLILEKASAKGVDTVELHYMARENGKMTMDIAHDIKIPARGKFAFDENGYHIMLIDLSSPLVENESIPISLYFKGLEPIVVEAKITGESN